MHWDGTITAGNVLTMVTIALGAIAVYVKLRERLIAIETRLEPLWAEFTERRTIVRRLEDRA